VNEVHKVIYRYKKLLELRDFGRLGGFPYAARDHHGRPHVGSGHTPFPARRGGRGGGGRGAEGPLAPPRVCVCVRERMRVWGDSASNIPWPFRTWPFRTWSNLPVAISNVVKFTRGHFERGQIISTLKCFSLNMINGTNTYFA